MFCVSLDYAWFVFNHSPCVLVPGGSLVVGGGWPRGKTTTSIGNSDLRIRLCLGSHFGVWWNLGVPVLTQVLGWNTNALGLPFASGNVDSISFLSKIHFPFFLWLNRTWFWWAMGYPSLGSGLWLIKLVLNFFSSLPCGFRGLLFPGI